MKKLLCLFSIVSLMFIAVGCGPGADAGAPGDDNDPEVTGDTGG